jgi:hypothetical protein
MRNASDENGKQNLNTYSVFNNPFFEKRAVYEIMWKTIVELDWQHITKWRMGIACWIPKAINTHAGYVILIASPLQQWLLERSSSLRYMYIDCLV